VWDRQRDDVAELQARVADLEARLGTVFGVLGVMRPAAMVLSHSGADASQQQAFFTLVDEMTRRVESGSSVSFSDFEERVADIVPATRGNRKFFELLLEALKVERPGAKPVIEYLTHGMSLFRI
jgi:hypothetical protein